MIQVTSTVGCLAQKLARMQFCEPLLFNASRSKSSDTFLVLCDTFKVVWQIYSQAESIH